jgi:hypothetical protein
MKQTRSVVVALLSVACVSVAAQDTVMFDAASAVAVDSQPGLDIIAFDPLSVGPAVLNAPYAAEAVTEFTQTLADGNRIERRTSGRVARNSQGRVRREQQGIAFGPFLAENPQPIVTIVDPKIGVYLTLNYDAKVAFRTTAPRFAVKGPNGDAAGVSYGSVGSAGPGLVKSTIVGGTPLETLRIDAASDPTEERLLIEAAPPPGLRIEGDTHTETLAPQQIEGLRAEGTRTTMTIPAGAMGNVLPIMVVSERWYSPELKVVLLTRRSDPRFGDTVYRLSNIDRSEPPADLFKIPAGFKTQEMKPGLPMPPKPDGWQ